MSETVIVSIILCAGGLAEPRHSAILSDYTVQQVP